jgi:glycosyltransferase involved in cell wall biosynthesis
MTDEPLVSVVINNYNYARFLSVAIESALGQTHPRTETIVVDDGSTDESRSVIASFGERIHVVLKPNGGQASAINAGFERCSGDVVIFLDADDMLLPGTAAAVAKHFRAAPGTARVQYRLAVIDAEGMGTGELIPAEYVSMPSGDLRSGLVRFNNLTWWPPTSGNAFSSAILRRILPMPEEPFRASMDYYLVRASTLCGPVVSLDEVGARYRRHDSNDDFRENLDLDQVRAHVELIRGAHHHLRRFAESVEVKGFAADADEVADLRFLAMRMISLKLDPAKHPVRGDTLTGLARWGVRVARQQTHLPARVRWLTSLWFVAMRLAPRSQARILGEGYDHPEKRRPFNRFLKRT